VNRPTSGAPASEEAGSTRAAEAAARPRAGDPQAGQVRPRTVTCKQVAEGARRSGRAHRGGLRIDAVSGLAGRMSVQLTRACETVAEAKLTASGRSLSPEHPEGARPA
jgi:hypothetical protein